MAPESSSQEQVLLSGIIARRRVESVRRKNQSMFDRHRLRILAALGVLSLNACVAHYTRDQRTTDNYRYTPAVTDSVREHTIPGPVELGPAERTLRHHDVIPLSYASTGNNGHAGNRVEGLYLRSRQPGSKKLVIVLPIWGSSRYPPRKISYGYAEHSRGDAHVVWLFGEPPLFPWQTLWSTSSEDEWIDVTEEGIERFRTAVNDTRRLIDWLGTREEVDQDKIAIIGFSMGALAAATIMGSDARVSAGVYMVGGAKFTEVMARCRGKAGRMREHALKSFDWSLDEYRRFFAERIGPVEPTLYAGHFNPDKILIIDARFDNCIPRVSRDALWEATGYPERITMLYRHKSAFYSLTPLGFNFARGIIYRFLDEAL